MISTTTMHSLKKSGIVTVMSLFVLTYAMTPAFAQSPTMSTGARGTARLESNITRLKTRGDAEIDRRVTALNTLVTKIGAMKRLTDAQTATFTSGIQGQVAILTALKTKIDADTDIAVLRTDVQSIIKSYRIFALYMPQVAIMSHADRMLAIIDEMNQISGKLQKRIDAAKSAGHDITSMVALMTDRANKLSDASTQAENALNAVLPLTPAGYPGNKATLMSARTMLQTGRADLVAAEKDASQVRQTLKSFGKVSPSLSPTP